MAKGLHTMSALVMAAAILTVAAAVGIVAAALDTIRRNT